MAVREPRFLVEHPSVCLWVIAFVALVVWGKGMRGSAYTIRGVGSHRENLSVPHYRTDRAWSPVRQSALPGQAP
jgi:hypothetical protein